MKDIGILASLDPVAIDQACLDLVYAAKDDPGQKHFLKRVESTSAPMTKDDHLSIYPKYTDGDLYIEGLSGKSSIIIYSPNGKKMVSRRLRQPNAYFYVGEWRAGLYMVVIEDEKGRVQHQILKF